MYHLSFPGSKADGAWSWPLPSVAQFESDCPPFSCIACTAWTHKNLLLLYTSRGSKYDQTFRTLLNTLDTSAPSVKHMHNFIFTWNVTRPYMSVIVNMAICQLDASSRKWFATAVLVYAHVTICVHVHGSGNATGLQTHRLPLPVFIFEFYIKVVISVSSKLATWSLQSCWHRHF